jgi:DNA-binding transcriptional LysR family regulator
MLDLNALALFAKVAEARSFSGAARQTGTPTSTVSRRIADLETLLGVRLIERSTRSLRLTDVGAEILRHARHGTEIVDAVESIVSHHRSEVAGFLRLSAPPSISDSLLVPLVTAFQELHPAVRVQLFITERTVDLIVDGVDLAFVVGAALDSTHIRRRLLSYRHRLVASPSYLAGRPLLLTPDDLVEQRLLSFAYGSANDRWLLRHENGRDTATVPLRPTLAMNDYMGIASALVAGAGVGELPPIVHPELVRDGRLVEVLPAWHLDTLDLSLVRIDNAYLPRAVRVFEEFAAERAPKVFPILPT